MPDVAIAFHACCRHHVVTIEALNLLLSAVLPELAADDHLMGFWKSISKEDVLSVSYEQFAVALDEKFGQSLWSEFPEIANKGT